MTTIRRSTSPSHLGPERLSPVSTGDLNARHVTGHYELLDGTPVRGTIKFTARTVLMDATSDLILMPETYTATLDDTGSFDILLPVTDDPDITPIGWTYTVTETFANAAGRQPYAIQVPYEAGADTPISIRALMTVASGGTGVTTVAAGAADQDLTLTQGDDFDFSFRIKDANGNYTDLTGQVPESQIRASLTAPDVLATFTAVLGDQVASPGLVVLSLTGAQTAALDTAPKVWDVQLTDTGGKVTTYLSGKVIVKPQVTR